jgi:hypothetical protein
VEYCICGHGRRAHERNPKTGKYVGECWADINRGVGFLRWCTCMRFDPCFAFFVSKPGPAGNPDPSAAASAVP